MRNKHPTYGRAAVLCVLLVGVALAGCTDADDGVPTTPPDVARSAGNDAPILTDDGRDLREDLRATDEVPAPAWAIGDWFGVHAYFGGQDQDGSHYDAVVVGVEPEAYTMAASDPQVAKEASLYGIPLLSAISREDLSMPTDDGPWDFFRFPMKDGGTWEGSIPNIAFDVIEEDTVPLTMTAEFKEDINTPEGRLPGFVVTGRTQGGALVVATDFIPALGWFANLVVYDIDPQQDPIEIRATSMGHGIGWTGDYYIDTAEMVVFNFDGAGFDDAPPEGQPFAEPSPYVSFTVPDGPQYLTGFVYAFAVAGARGVVLVPPEGEPRHYEYAGVEGETFVWIDEHAAPGEWRLATAGAGGVSLSEVWLNAITETKGTL